MPDAEWLGPGGAGAKREPEAAAPEAPVPGLGVRPVGSLPAAWAWYAAYSSCSVYAA